MQMRICLFLPSFLPEIGGLEKAADNLALQLTSFGHKVVVFTQRSRKTSATVQRPYPIIYYKRTCSPGWFPFSVGLALRRLQRKFNFDVICAYQAYLPGYIATRLGRRHNIPVILFCRGGDISERGRYLKRWLPRRRIIWALKHANAVTALNKHLAQRVSILTDNRIETSVIHNGINLMVGDPTSCSIPTSFAHLENKSFILALSRLRRFKGLDVLLDAMKLLKDQNITVPLLVIAGDGPERVALAQQLADNGLADCVSFVGEVLKHRKAWLFSNCQFLVHPSRGDEGFPHSALEAMSYAKPVLATATEGLSEMVTDGVSGLLIEPNNAESLAKGLQRMLTADLSSYGRNALKVAQEHSWEKITKLYLGLYQSVLQVHSAQCRGGGRAQGVS